MIRVFNGGLAGKWQRGGRFYCGWWQQIDKEDRCKIYINDQPTLEVDFKAFHPNLLSNELGVRLADDPYDLGELTLPDVITTKEQQRDYVKLLVLMGINADSAKKAYQAFRNSDRKDKLGQRLIDKFRSAATCLHRETPTVQRSFEYRTSPKADEYRQSDCQHGIGPLYE